MNEENEQEEKSFTFVDKRRIDAEEENGEDGAKAAGGAADTDSAPVKADESAVADKPGGEDKNQAGAPPIDFTTFILSLSSSALYHLGGFQDPVSGKTSINLDLAKQTIDIIDILKEKTTGNLDEGETKLIESVLYDLKMKFVEVSKGESPKQ